MTPVTPDVTVVVPVHDTMPYLLDCLDSLVAQTIARDGRVEVVAVDDGSTDESGGTLDRYAATYPHLVRTFHQVATGSPAVPRNRALDEARGRYVFFLDADDYLAPQALERLVARADEWGSDIVFGRMVGVNGRHVDQRIYEATLTDIDLAHPLLPYSLANTKLFRRSLIEDNGLRFDTDVRIGSDQPFTVAAMHQASRISVLADDTYYYAVRRADASNISYSSPWRTRLHDTGSVMGKIAGILPAGELRDNVLSRHFGWELNKLLSRSWPDLDDTERAELCAGVGVLAERYLTEGVSSRLWVGPRVRLMLAWRGEVDRLGTAVDFQRSQVQPSLVLAGERMYLALPGFRDELPDEWFEALRESPWARLQASLRTCAVRLAGGTMELRGRIELGARSAANVSMVLVAVDTDERIGPLAQLDEPVPPATFEAPVQLRAGKRRGFARLTATVDLATVPPDEPVQRWAVRVRVRVGPATYDLPVYSWHHRIERVPRGAGTMDVLAGPADAGRLVVTRLVSAPGGA